VYRPSGGGWDQYVPVILMFVRIIGVGAIIRSIILISRSGSSGGQPGTLGKALILFMSGLLLIHIVGVYYLLEQILDIA
jgi:intracellular multiplication protein IcmC